MLPLKRQLIANAWMLLLFVTLPLWVMPVILWKLYRYSYEEICGWDDFDGPAETE